MTTSAQAAERLPESASLLLDILRFGLAVLVVVGHLSLPFFSTAWPPLLAWADAAVPAFFVLSGFMIRHVTQDRERDPRRYLISRASRMYSVLLPAIILTLVCSATVRHLDPGYAASLFQDEGSLSTSAHTAAHLLFFTQFWGHAVLLPPNLPLWSLGYEVPYYILFGLLMLCKGTWRWFAIAAYALLLGPQVLFLLPLWWSGCWLYDLWQWARRKGVRSRRMAAISFLSAIALTALLLPAAGTGVWRQIASLPNPLLFLHQPTERATMLAYASGAVAWTAMLLGLVLSDQVRIPTNTSWAKPVRRVSEGTFALYLFHYPLLCLIVPLLGRTLHTNAETWAAFLLITAACVLAAIPTDSLKTWMRQQLSKHATVQHGREQWPSGH